MNVPGFHYEAKAAWTGLLPSHCRRRKKQQLSLEFQTYTLLSYWCFERTRSKCARHPGNVLDMNNYREET